jgi:nucleoside-diphosphate-sugar epimerase
VHVKKILLLGASGFIGRGVYERLDPLPGIDVIRHSRSPRAGYTACEIGSPAFDKLVDESDCIVNCTGIGLSRLGTAGASNKALTEQILAAIKPGATGKKPFFHLSSVKAHNPEQRVDAYADDKYAAEQVIHLNSDKVQGVILRVPTVLGRHDKNLLPMISMCRLKLLPKVTGQLPALHVIGVESIATCIIQWLVRVPDPALHTYYLLSDRTVTYNDLVGEVYARLQPLARSARLRSVSVRGLAKVYKVLTFMDRFRRGRKLFPWARFNDLFVCPWHIESGVDVIQTPLRVSALIGDYFENAQG